MSVGLSVCHSSRWTRVWDKEACIKWQAHWRHLANSTESPMCGGDAAFLSNYFDDHLLLLLSSALLFVTTVVSFSLSSQIYMYKGKHAMTLLL